MRTPRSLYRAAVGLPEPSSLDRLVDAVRNHEGLRAKRAIGAVRRAIGDADPLDGPGDDGAAVKIWAAGTVIVCGEAIHPDFVASDPRGAGIAAVLANVNDLAAMGAVPRGIVNTVVAPASVAAEALRGMAEGAALYDVPIVGGHITEHEGEPALSAFAVGDADTVLSASRASPGQQIVFVCCLDGRMRADFDFFTTLASQGPRLARDVRLFAQAARDGLASAAKDVSMAGSVGSLAMLLEPGRLGAEIDLHALPAPEGVELDRWLVCFPTYAFWLCTDTTRRVRRPVPLGRARRGRHRNRHRQRRAHAASRHREPGRDRPQAGARHWTVGLGAEHSAGVRPSQVAAASTRPFIWRRCSSNS